MPPALGIDSPAFRKLLLRISIRGRVAIAAWGIELYLRQCPEYGGPDVEKALRVLWNFAEIDEVWKWDNQDLALVFDLKTEDGVLYDMMENAVDIAREHLYSSPTMEFEKTTIRLLVENLTLLEGFGVYAHLPAIQRLAAFSPSRRLGLLLDEGSVWGKPFKREEFVANFGGTLIRFDRGEFIGQIRGGDRPPQE